MPTKPQDQDTLSDLAQDWLNDCSLGRSRHGQSVGRRAWFTSRAAAQASATGPHSHHLPDAVDSQPRDEIAPAVCDMGSEEPAPEAHEDRRPFTSKSRFMEPRTTGQARHKFAISAAQTRSPMA
jgi:hypothetical protein